MAVRIQDRQALKPYRFLHFTQNGECVSMALSCRWLRGQLQAKATAEGFGLVPDLTAMRLHYHCHQMQPQAKATNRPVLSGPKTTLKQLWDIGGGNAAALIVHRQRPVLTA